MKLFCSLFQNDLIEYWHLHSIQKICNIIYILFQDLHCSNAPFCCSGYNTCLEGLGAAGFVNRAVEEAWGAWVTILWLRAPSTQTPNLTVSAIHHLNELPDSEKNINKQAFVNTSFLMHSLFMKAFTHHTHFNMKRRSGFLSSRLG